MFGAVFVAVFCYAELEVRFADFGAATDFAFMQRFVGSGHFRALETAAAGGDFVALDGVLKDFGAEEG